MFHRYRHLLVRYLAPLGRQVALLLTLLAVGIGLQLAGPQVVRGFIDATQSGGPSQGLALAAAAFLAIGFAERAARLATFYLSQRIGWQATNALRADLTRHCLGLDMSFHKRHTPGELVERIDGDVTALAGFFAQFVGTVLSNGLLILGILVVLGLEDWRLGLALAAYTAVVFGALRLVQDLATRRWAEFRELVADLLSFLEERLGGAEDIRASGAEAHTLAQLDGIMGRMMAVNLRARLLGNLTFLTSNSILYTGYALALAAGALLYLRGEATVGTALMIVFYMGMLAGPLENLRQQIQDLQEVAASVGRIDELFAERPSVTEAPRASLPAGPLAVELDGVTFAYRDEPDADGGERPVIAGLSLSLAPGQVLGLLGRTGSGKTTLTRLLFRLYDPQAGAVRLGGADVRDLALADLRARVGMVTQEVQIFQATLRDNLALFSPRVDDARIWAALAELGLDGWARSLPQGLDTELTAGGQGLSAGEAQLLAFARVFLKDPGLVILDEASSRLDPATEALLERAVDRLLRGRTAIIIAHRLGTVQRADTIAILEGGQLLEHGPRAALAASPSSRFAELLRTGMEEVLA